MLSFFAEMYDAYSINECCPFLFKTRKKDERKEKESVIHLISEKERVLHLILKKERAGPNWLLIVKSTAPGNPRALITLFCKVSMLFQE